MVFPELLILAKLIAKNITGIEPQRPAKIIIPMLPQRFAEAVKSLSIVFR